MAAVAAVAAAADTDAMAAVIRTALVCAGSCVCRLLLSPAAPPTQFDRTCDRAAAEVTAAAAAACGGSSGGM